ncbi:MAG TPA: 4-(cytidine 5'-diphospho)-2-C-methyl-D-erythritol kinase [Thermoguttaceae bacterium]|nr:4-(cytidine 5'-diphospho)-2-C-methyl-D-erythritol kinase [Thermoguttaceae bacterium]
MLVHRSSVGWVVQTPAKLNLFFEVLGKRHDGFHEIETLMTPIGLLDTLHFLENSTGQIAFECRRAGTDATLPNNRATSGVPTDVLPTDERNLVVRAIDLFRRATGVRHGARVRLIKRIPIAAGLGGGSSDAAAALVAANHAWQVGWSRSQLALLAAELGSDVPFFLGDGPAVCRGRGERIEPITPVGTMTFVVVRPPEGLSTAAVYGVCRPATTPRPIDPILNAFRRGDSAAVGRLLFNRLQPAARKLSVWTEKLEDALSREDCLGHLMSGSGTCFFAICRHERHARRVARRLQATGIGTAYAVRTTR